ncbi:MAG: hypothetical protein J5651_00315 [Salinivirgaceae bacterium]|nr:hypothetical protein [Salinivirgaceae bacterium]
MKDLTNAPSINQEATPAVAVEAYHWYMYHEWTLHECRYLFGRDAEHLFALYEKYVEQSRTTQWGADDLFFTILKDDEKDCLVKQAITCWLQRKK